MYMDYDDVRDDLPGVIALKGTDHIYTPDGLQCQYVTAAGPSCLIGYYLVELGVPTSFFTGKANYMEIDQLIESGKLDKWVVFSAEAVIALAELQNLQDTCTPWGEAYDRVFEPTKDIDA